MTAERISMRRALASLTFVLSLAAGPALADDALAYEKFWLTPNFGTLGAGVEGGWRWNESWGMRVGINGFDTTYVYHDKNSDLHSHIQLLNAGVTADYYLWDGNFRLSAGGRISANQIKGKVRNLEKKTKSNGSNISVIIADPLASYTVEQNMFQPYIGTGYSYEIDKKVSLNFDIGALYAGTPELTVHSRAGKFGFTDRQIRREIDRARDRIAPFQVYPVVQVGLNFKF